MVVPITVFKAVYPTSLLRVVKSNFGLHNKCPRKECLNSQAYVRSLVMFYHPRPSSELKNNTKIGKICQSVFGNVPFSTSSIAACDLRPTKPISMTFYYDTISPYSWLAFEVLQRYRPIWNLEIDFKPVYMGGISQENNNKFLESLTTTPNRAAYIFQDIVRQGEFYQVPLRVPESPLYLLAVAGSLKQQRFLTAVKRAYPEYLESCSRDFWYRSWSEDLDATKDTSIYMIASRAGLKEDEILQCLEDLQTDDLKNALKETTSEAVEAGAFGLPFMVIDREKSIETFWGSDRFEIMANSLGLEWHGPFPDNVCYVPIPMPNTGAEDDFFEPREDDVSTNKDFSLPDNFTRPNTK